MKIALYCIGKDHKGFISEGINEYVRRIKKYIPFEYNILPDTKKLGNSDTKMIKLSEAETILKALPDSVQLILLDEKGKQFTSVGFSGYLEKIMIQTRNPIVFLIGGAFGFHEKIYERASFKISLSGFTFSHQLARIIFLEQLYRAFTILHNEPYHNE